jgi:ATP-binding cassette subfamily F protein 3
MTLVDLQNVAKTFSGEPVFQDISWQINSGRKIGLIGANGCGKTTLFRIIAAELRPERGEVFRAKNLRVGFLRQEIQLEGELSLFDEMLKPFQDLLATHRELQELERIMATSREGHGQGHLAEILHRYSELREKYERSGGYTYESEIKSVLSGLGFSDRDLPRRAGVLSGGQKNIAALAQVLLSKPQLLLLDEPTNHLDIEATRWLERFLKEFIGTVIVVSHDRYFLDRAVEEIAELELGQLQRYPGNYSSYRIQKQELMARQSKQYQLQQAHIRRTEDFIRRNIAGQKTKQAQSRRKSLERLERIAPPPSEGKRLRPRLKTSGREGRVVLRFEKVTKGFDGHPIFQELSFSVQRGERVALLGPNGSGKSTLLKIAMGLERPDMGSCQMGHNVRIGYYEQDLAGLDSSCTVLAEVWKARPDLLQPELRSHLARFLFQGEEVTRLVGSLSGGEQSRVALAKLMLSPANLLLLDEPTNHLDIASRDALEEALSGYDGTLLLVSHDRYFLDKAAERILHLEGGRVREYLGNYKTYREKRAQEEALARKERGRKKAVVEKPLKHSGLSKKKLESIEAEIAYLEKELEEIDRLLENPELSTDWQALRSLHAQRQDLSDKLDDLLDQWMVIAESIGERAGKNLSTS